MCLEFTRIDSGRLGCAHCDSVWRRHGRCRQHPRGYTRSMLPVDEERLAQILDNRLAAKLQRAPLQRVRTEGQPCERRGEKVEDIRAQRGITHLRRIGRDQLSRRNALLKHFLHLVPHRPKKLLRHARHPFLLALVQANHLLMDQRLQCGMRIGAVKTVQYNLQESLSRRVFLVFRLVIPAGFCDSRPSEFGPARTSAPKLSRQLGGKPLWTTTHPRSQSFPAKSKSPAR